MKTASAYSKLVGITSLLQIQKSSEVNIQPLLQRVVPFGATSLYDVVVVCLMRVSQFAQQLLKEHNSSITPLIIVLTDGSDTSSVTPGPDFAEFVFSNPDTKIQVIAIDIPQFSEDNIKMRGIASINDTNMSVTDVKSMNLAEYFEILANEMLKDSIADIINEDKNPHERELNQVQNQKSYLVIFALDISESMLGKKWETLRVNLEIIIKRLARGNHYVGFVLFNHHILQPNDLHFLGKFVVESCDCCSTPSTLMCGLFCPCIAVCCFQNYSLKKATGKKSNPASFCASMICAYPIGCALNRRELRKAYNIEGSCCADCLKYCVCAGLCLAGQEALEAKKRGLSRYLA